MKTQWSLGLALAMAALAATAQTTAPSDTVPRGAPVVSDTAPPPAEDRDSSGAIVMDRAPLRVMPGSLAPGDTRSMGAGPKNPPKARSRDPEELRRPGAPGTTGK